MEHVSKKPLIFLAFFCITRVVLLLTATLVAADALALTAETPAAVGYLDTISVKDDKFIAQGWVAPVDSNRKVIGVVIKVGDTIIYEGPYHKVERPDVAAAMQRNDWVNSGWRVTSDIASNLKPGKYAVAVQAKMDSGEIIDLGANNQGATIKISANQSSGHTRIMILLGLCGCILLVIASFYCAETATRKLDHLFERRFHPGVIPALALLLFFAGLVGMGTTGSSLELGVNQSPFVNSDAVRIWGTPKAIRTDEWIIMTPLALAQANHIPAFPVINKNVGEDGQNMLIIGMTGAPVNHITAIAKPATWGFYFLDLQRALSWYWWFPIFGCLFALWAVFSLISPGHWRIGFLVSLSFCASAYVTAWSYWPAYTAFFPGVMLYSSVAILRTGNIVSSLGWALLLGLAFVGFVLVLYPPWQVSLGYLFLIIGLGVVGRDKLYRRINALSLLSFTLAVGLAMVILWKWWLDAGSAVAAMMNTIYPGQRDSEVGGSWTVTKLLHGFTNLITLYRNYGGYYNESEIASFYYMFPSLLVLFAVRLREKKIGFIQSLLLLFMGFAVVFMLVGMPKELATLTLWGRVPVFRVDLSLGLAYLLLSGALLASNKASYGVYNLPVKLIAAIVSLMWGGIVFYAMSKIPQDTLDGFSPGISVALFLVIFFESWWLATGDYRKFLLLNLAFSFATASAFNPLMVAPHRVVSVADSANDRSRVLVANAHDPAMLLLASGQPVSNGTFYYPQKRMWERLDPQRTRANIYNRYQHLIFTLGSVASPYYRIESPDVDVVKVIVDTTQFDFRKTGADVLLAPSNDLNALKLNPSLKFVSDSDGWSRFVIPKLGDQ